jgi:hypothetical protein
MARQVIFPVVSTRGHGEHDSDTGAAIAIYNWAVTY